MRSWKLVGVWVLVLVITTALTWQIVSLASDQVADEPLAIAPATSTTLGSSTSSSSTTTSTTVRQTTTSITGPTDGSSPTTSTPAGAGGTSSSSATSPTSTAAEWSLRTITTEGGTVVVRYRPNEVELQAATPTPGFEMDIDETGPPRVRVEFENDDNDIRVEARWEGGGLDVDVTGDS